MQNLTLSQAVQNRESLFGEIDDNLKKLKRDFKKNPTKIDVETTFKLFNQLRIINANIENRKSENLKRKKCCNCLSGKYISVITIVIIGLQFVAWFAIAGISINNFWKNWGKSEDTGESGRDIAEVAITLVALLITTVFVVGMKGIDDDKERYKLLASISKLERQGEEHFQKFFLAFNDFKNSQKKGDIVQKQKLSKCVHHLDNLPESGYRNKIPSRDHWISLLINMLPDNHPIKKKILELKAVALKIIDLESESNSSSAELSLKTSGKFKGEKMTLPNLFQVPKTAKTLALKQEGSEEEKESLLSPKQQNRQIYKREWKQLEKDLEVKLNCIQMGKHCFDKECNVSKKLENLPTYNPPVEPDINRVDELLTGSVEFV